MGVLERMYIGALVKPRHSFTPGGSKLQLLPRPNYKISWCVLILMEAADGDAEGTTGRRVHAGNGVGLRNYKTRIQIARMCAYTRK